MKHFPKYTVSGLVLAFGGLAFLLTEWLWAGALLALTGYLVAMKEFSKFTSPLQFFTQFFSAATVGVLLDWPLTGVPYLVLVMLLSALVTFGRIVFFRFFGYTNYAWFEPATFIIALGVHLAGIFMGHGDWKAWVIPAPAFFFAAVIGWGILKDKKQLLGVTLKGYKIAIGGEAPAFSLPDQNGELVQLSDFKGSRHLLLIFVRGDWCPGCHMMLRTYQKEAERFRSKNIFVLSVGPDPVGVNKEMVERLGLDFKVLADEGQKTAMIYGVQMQEYDNDFAEKYDEGIPLPASFLVDKQGVVRYVSRPDRVGEFLNPSLIFPIIEKLN
ncbi:MAG: peroxiredoxin [Bacteroidetes bacterium]|nr:MAG: peroxiredoxin [Bacteroidota bacterium]